MPELYEYQKKGARFLANKKKGFLCFEQGLGKTATSIMAAQKYTPLLIVCPAIAKINWQRELELWSVLPIKSQIVKTGKDPIDKSCNAFIFSYEMFVKRFEEIKSLPFKTGIFDEAHYCKGGMEAKRPMPKMSQRTKCACEMIMKLDRAYALTGTPMPNGPVELWPLLRAFKLTDLSFRDYAKRYCGLWKAPFGWVANRATNLEELGGVLKSGMYRKRKKEVLKDLPDKTHQIVSLDLPVDEREKEYDLDAIELHMKSVAFEGLAELMKLQGLSKVPMATEYVKDMFASGSVKKLILVAHHREVQQKMFENLRKFNPVLLTGGMSDKKRQEAMDRFQNDESVKVIVLSLQAGKTAITLTAANTMLL